MGRGSSGETPPGQAGGRAGPKVGGSSLQPRRGLWTPGLLLAQLCVCVKVLCLQPTWVCRLWTGSGQGCSYATCPGEGAVGTLEAGYTFPQGWSPNFQQ